MKVLVNLEPGRGWGHGEASKLADKYGMVWYGNNLFDITEKHNTLL